MQPCLPHDPRPAFTPKVCPSPSLSTSNCLPVIFLLRLKTKAKGHFVADATVLLAWLQPR